MNNVIDLPGNPNFVLKGIRLGNGKRCVYWTNKSVKQIDEVMVVFDNKNAVEITDNQICISLNGIEDIESQRECLRVFFEQLRIMGIDARRIKFNFVVADRQQEVVANNLIGGLGVNALVVNYETMKKNIDNNKSLEKVEQKIDDKLSNDREISGKSDIYTINRDGQEIVVDTARGIASDITHNALSMREMMKVKYEELMKDPIRSKELARMNDEQIIDYISRLVRVGNKEYELGSTSGRNKEVMDDKEKASLDIAEKNNGVVNTELGITVNDSRYTDSRFSSIEKRNDDSISVSNPYSSGVGVNSTNDTMGPNYNVRSVDNTKKVDDSLEFVDKDIQDREEKEVPYYVDRDGTVYNGNTKEALPGYRCNENNEILNEKGVVVGVNYGNLNEMNEKEENKRAKTLRYKPLVTYEKKENDSGFITLPVVIFIISLILLGSSGIIWFITK